MTLSIYATARGDPTGWFAEWHPGRPEWFNAMWWRWDSDLLAFGCSLLAPAVIVAAGAAVAWYRKVRPFERAGRFNRSRQFRWTRWGLTAMTLLLLGAALLSHSYRVRWQAARHQIVVASGELWWTPDGSATAPWVGRFSLEPLEDKHSPPYFVLYEWLRIGSRTTLQLSMWLVTSVSLAGAMALWYVRWRRYPYDGRCSNPECRYDLTGIEPGQPCPECGRIVAEPGV